MHKQKQILQFNSEPPEKFRENTYKKKKKKKKLKSNVPEPGYYPKAPIGKVIKGR